MEVKSSWASQTIWAQIVGAIAILAARYGVDIDAETQAALIMVIAFAIQAFTVIRRKYFTASVTPTVAAKIGA
jgi:hypothetical protein